MGNSEYIAAWKAKETIEANLRYEEGWLTSKCWAWTRSTNKEDGYGQIVVDYQHWTTHRLAWILGNNREIPIGCHVHHRCENKLCANPKHLQVVTAKEHGALNKEQQSWWWEVEEDHGSELQIKRDLLTDTIEGPRQMSSLYTCRTITVSKWQITKFDLDLNILATYAVDWGTCECPRGAHPDCRHRKMLKLFVKGGHVNDGWFLDYETRLWTKPLQGIVDEYLEGVTNHSIAGDASPSPSPATEGNGATIPSAPEVSSLRTPSGATYLNQFCFIRRL